MRLLLRNRRQHGGLQCQKWMYQRDQFEADGLLSSNIRPAISVIFGLIWDLDPRKLSCFQKKKCLSHSHPQYHVSVIPDSFCRVPTFASGRPFVSIRLLIIRHDYWSFCSINRWFYMISLISKFIHWCQS